LAEIRKTSNSINNLVASPKVMSKESLADLKAKMELYQILEQRERCQDSLRDFVEAAWPYIDSAPFQSCFAIDAMADHLEAVTFGHIPRLLINLPPRCAKSKTVSIIYPAWVWARNHDITYLSGPQVKFLCASYSDKLTLDCSNEFRRLVQSDWYQARWPIKFMSDQNTKGHMDNAKGGSRKATSVRGSLLGLGGDIIIGDDLNNTEKTNDKSTTVETGADREQAKNFWNELRSTRRNDPRDGHFAVINVQQRTHFEDISGAWMESGEDLVNLMIPMRHDPLRHCITVKLPQYDDEESWEDPRDRNGYDLMWPERFGELEVRGLEKALGPYLAAGRLQQLPTPKGGGIIQRDWWQPWDEIEAAKYGLEWQHSKIIDGKLVMLNRGCRDLPHMELVVGSLDTAFKEKEENDYNAFTIWGIFLDQARNRRAMLMYAWHKRLPLNGTEVTIEPGEHPTAFKQRQEEAWGLVDWVAAGCKKYKVKRLLIEDKSRGHDVANEIRRLHSRENWGVQLLDPVGDKISRAHSIVPLFTDKAIYAPYNSDTNTYIRWADEVIEECVVEGTLIITDQGVKSVEVLQVGDRVLTHKGRFRPVLGLSSRMADNIIVLEPKSLDPIALTKDHPVYAFDITAERSVRSGTNVDWIPAGNLKAREYRQNNRGGILMSEAAPNACHAMVLPIIKPENYIDEIDLRDWATLPNGKDYNLFETEDRFTSSHSKVKWVRWRQPLDYRFGRIIGLYLAEGSGRRSQTFWSFHAEELDFINEVQSFIEERLGCGSFIKTQGRGTTVVANLPLIESFFEDCGRGATNKHIPEWVWDAPDVFIQGILDGYMDGDGYYNFNNKMMSAGTVSVSLAWGIRLLALRLGIHATISVGNEAGVSTIKGRTYNVLKSYRVSWRCDRKNNGSTLVVDDLAAYSIMKTSPVSGEARVFNMDVAEDHSYCTTAGVVHNCLKFPKGAHDDYVDTVTMFLNWARDNEILVMASEMEASMEEAATFGHNTESVADLYGV
jgi:phage terminase large subunit-like protein